MSDPENLMNLAEKMRDLAVKGHPRANELVEKALALAQAIDGFYSEPQTVKADQLFMHWDQARRLWCDCADKGIRMINGNA
jgi:hypothetical protein